MQEDRKSFFRKKFQKIFVKMIDSHLGVRVKIRYIIRIYFI